MNYIINLIMEKDKKDNSVKMQKTKKIAKEAQKKLNVQN